MSAVARRRLPRLGGAEARVRLLLGVLVTVLVLLGAFLWVRQSSLVAVRHVTVTGVSGPEAGHIRGALTAAARGMSTLDLDARRLHAAVAPYAVVRALHLHAEFPHGLHIEAVEQIPVAIVSAAGQHIAVAADGSLLRGARVDATLPTIAVSAVPGGADLTGPARADVALLAAAPPALLSRIRSAGSTAGGLGLTVALREGPAIYFGADTALTRKWRAAVAALASPQSDGASYIDVTDPARPAAGAGQDTTPAAPTPATPGDPSSASALTTG